MQGIGVLIFVVGYAAAFTAYQQGFGPGGSFLYWLTGNPRMGQPTQSQPGGNGKPSASSVAIAGAGGSIAAARGGIGLQNFQNKGIQPVP